MTGPPPDRMTHALPRMRVAARRPPRGQQQRPEAADDAMRGKRTSRFSQPALALVTGPASCDDKPPAQSLLAHYNNERILPFHAVPGSAGQKPAAAAQLRRRLSKPSGRRLMTPR